MWRTRLGRGVPTESVARPSGRPEPVSRVAAGRRSIAPSRTSSTARAGETGETDPPRTGSALADPKGMSRVAGDPSTPSAFAASPPPDTGHAPPRLLHVAFRYPCEHRVAWPGDAGLPFSSSPDGAPGVPDPSQVCSRIRVDARRAIATPLGGRFSITAVLLGISAGPGPRAVRAPRPPRLIFVGVTDRLCVLEHPGLGMLTDLQKRSAGVEVASTSGRRLPSAIRVAGPLEAQVGPAIDPALGFAPCRVVGHAFDVHRPGSTPSDHPPPEPPRPADFAGPDDAYPLMGFRRSSPSRLRESCSRRTSGNAEVAFLPSCRRPFSVLMGLMPCPLRTAFAPRRTGSLSEVLHRP
jgi:hypothetical protein